MLEELRPDRLRDRPIRGPESCDGVTGRTGPEPPQEPSDSLAPAEMRKGKARSQGPYHASNPPPTKMWILRIPPKPTEIEGRDVNTCKIYNTPCRHWIGGCYGCTACPGEKLSTLSLKGSRSPDRLTGLGTGGPCRVAPVGPGSLGPSLTAQQTTITGVIAP